ncbi:sugar phosphate isomerase/epimerase [Microvirga sp. BT689]|uniref:sugar phosphate isomerase/epimerase family protein n=1 Tax=Microvirga arvi TaxID=2778731 RepID=UPI00194ED6E2|nr:sugar phosphate isomerase/epimerase family protein [Microvirga arvi]MBM6584184.1 sugar phosphate isomerase/epimerase [Microvirga arvi]
MTDRTNSLILHTTVTKYSTLAMDAELAREIAFDGIELSASKVGNYLEAGYSKEELRQTLMGLNIPTLGFVTDIERTGEAFDELVKEAELHFELAAAAGATAVQLITGPIQVDAVRAYMSKTGFAGYSGLLGLDIAEQIKITASNVAALADRAQHFGLLVNFEALGWTPLNKLEHQLEVIERTGRDNVRLIVDFWHCYVSGDTPEQVAKLPAGLIYGIHVCDSRQFAGGIPDESVLRNVSTGEGVLDLQEWVDAVKATGYADWWSCELFSKRDWQGNSRSVAGKLHDLMGRLIRP